MSWRRTLEPFARPFFQVYWRLSRGAKLAVRGLVLNADGEVLLVEPTHAQGWRLPGGAVGPDETCEAALRRGLQREGSINVVGLPALLSIHASQPMSDGAHSLLYRIARWEPREARHDQEVTRMWFASNRLPSGIDEMTRQLLEAGLDKA